VEPEVLRGVTWSLSSSKKTASVANIHAADRTGSRFCTSVTRQIF
jgi:hypothetical protein